jgi:hypothetical protein
MMLALTIEVCLYAPKLVIIPMANNTPGPIDARRTGHVIAPPSR